MSTVGMTIDQIVGINRGGKRNTKDHKGKAHEGVAESNRRANVP